MRRLVLLGAGLLVIAGPPAFAKPLSGRFVHPADANGDERITRAEWVASGEDAAGFRAADANRDRAVTGAEFARWFMAKEGIAPVQASARQPSGAMNRLVER